MSSLNQTGTAYINTAAPGRIALKVNAAPSTDTSNCFASWKNPEFMKRASESATLVVNTLFNVRTKRMSNMRADVHTNHTHRVQKHASFFHLGQFKLVSTS